MKINRYEEILNKMITSSFTSNKGIIRFKFYGEFHVMESIYQDCKDNLFYIGNSNKDGSPIFEYNYYGISEETLKDFNKLNILLRKYKIHQYMKKDMDKNEKSLIVFMKFFMSAYEENEIKNAVYNEITKNEFKYED